MSETEKIIISDMASNDQLPLFYPEIVDQFNDDTGRNYLVKLSEELKPSYQAHVPHWLPANQKTAIQFKHINRPQSRPQSFEVESLVKPTDEFEEKQLVIQALMAAVSARHDQIEAVDTTAEIWQNEQQLTIDALLAMANAVKIYRLGSKVV